MSAIELDRVTKVYRLYEITEAACPFTVRLTGSDYGLVRLNHRWK